MELSRYRSLKLHLALREKAERERNPAGRRRERGSVGTLTHWDSVETLTHKTGVDTHKAAAKKKTVLAWRCKTAAKGRLCGLGSHSSR